MGFFSKIKRIGLATARAGNVIGGGDWSKDRLIPDCIRTIIKNENLVIRSPSATRPWQHVLEPISGYLILGKKLYKKPKIYSGSWNFGPQNNQTKNVKTVAKIVMKNSKMQNNINVEENLVSLISKIGEKITIGRKKTIKNLNGKLDGQ